MNTLNVNLENLTEDERETLTALIEKSQKPKIDDLLKPSFKCGDLYLRKDSYGKVQKTLWHDDEADRGAYALDNAHPNTPQNRGMLENQVEQQQAIVEVNRRVRMLIAEQHPSWICDWKDEEQLKCCPCYRHTEDKIGTNSWHFIQDQFTFEFAPEGIYEQIDEQLLKKAMGLLSDD